MKPNFKVGQIVKWSKLGAGLRPDIKKLTMRMKIIKYWGRTVQGTDYFKLKCLREGIVITTAPDRYLKEIT